MVLLRLRALLHTLRLRLRFLFAKERVEAEMDEELRFHLEREIESRIRRGVPPGEARREALLLFGGMERTREQVREARGVRHLEELAQDLRYTFRQMRRAPLFTATAILTLAVGIGANTGVFSVVNGLLLQNRPYLEPERLVHVYSSVEGQTLFATSFARDLEDLRALYDVFQGVGAFSGMASRISEDGAARMVLVEAVTANLFPLLGMEMQLGRGFAQEEDQVPGGHPLVVLGHSLWQRRYGADPGVVGETIRLGGRPFTIIGVAPESLESFTAQGFQTDLFVPMAMAGAMTQAENQDRMAEPRGPEGTKIIARLRDGVTVEQAQARAEGLALGLRRDLPELYRDRSFHLHPSENIALQPDLDAFLMTGAALLLAAVGLVLLLACTNLASFLLARGADRKREVALRLALGARRGRLIRQLLTETVTLGLLGAAAGLLVARWSLDLAAAAVPPTALPLNIDTGVDGSVLLFTAGIAGLAGILAGLVPALQSTNPDLAPTLKDGARGETGGKGRLSLRGVLVSFQVAVSMVLLVTGGLFVRSLTATQRVDPGFRTREAALLWVDLDVSGLPRAEWPELARVLKERAAGLPGVEVATVSNGIQLSESVRQASFALPGVEPPPGEETHRAFYLAVDQDYLATMGIDVVTGRGVESGDVADAEPVVVVSETAASRFWPDGGALGRRVELQGEGRTFRVVGVARDTRVANLRGGAEPLFYFPWAQFQRRTSQLWIVARGSSPTQEVVSELRRLALETDPDLVIVQAKTLRDQLDLALFLPRLGALVLGFFGTLALGLASVGLYGVVSHVVSQRTREVGVRMALGASGAAVIRMLVRDATTLTLAGSLLGFLAALGSVHLLDAYLAGVDTYDPVTLVGVPTLLVGVAALAALIPALRATWVNPALALKAD